MNKRFFNKLIAIILVIILSLANVLLLGYNTKTYATELNLDKQSVLTNNENVEFDAYYVDKSGQATHTIKQDINSNDLQLYLYAKVTKGYLKEISVNVFGENEKQNSNFQISNNIKDLETVESINTNTIKLKQIDKNEQVLIKIPIYANKSDIYDISNLNKQNGIKIVATYVNNNGKEEKINKIVKTNIEWTAQIKAVIEQEVSKNINLTANKGIMFQTVIRTGLENNNLPIKETQVSVKVPMLGNIKPNKVLVMANQTKGTNGKPGIEFGRENWNYDEATGTLTINTKNETVENKIVWDKTQKDEYVITYVFPENVVEQVNEESKVTQEVTTKINVYGNANQEAILNQEMVIDIKEKKGELISNSIVNSMEQLSKGYLYSKVDKEITYTLNNNVQIQDVELVDKVQINNKVESIMLNEKEKALGNFSTYEYTSINKKIFDKILGEDGNITIYNENGEVINTINKETTVENGNYICKYENKVDSITIETSKPVMEGNLIIESAKAINCNTSYSSEEIKDFETLKTTSETKAIYQEEQILHTEKIVQTKLIEPETKIEAEINKNQLSTMVKNEGVQIKVILKTNDETCMLYENPVVEVELPNCIENVEIKSIKLSYENELSYDASKLYVGLNNSGNQVIRIPLTGKNSDYNFDNVSKGANLLIDSNLTIKKLTPTANSNINVNVYNNNEVEQRANTQVGITTIAPTGIIGITQVSGLDKEVNDVFNGQEQTIKLNVNSKEKIANIKMDIVCNYLEICKNISILGKVPNNVAKLNSNVSINGEITGATIYYTSNENATKDLNVVANGWTTSTENLAQVKAYLIVIDGDKMPVGKIATINYDLVIPENLNYNLEGVLQSTIYYERVIKEQAIKEDSTTGRIILTTGQGPELEVSVKSSLGEGKEIQEGQEIKYTILVKNIGKSEVNNISVKANVPERAVYVYYAPNTEFIYDTENTELNLKRKYDEEKREYVETIDSIKPNETKTFEFFAEALPLINADEFDEETGESKPRGDTILEVTAVASVNGYDKIFSSNTTKNKVIEGALSASMKIEADYDTVARKAGDIVEYSISISNKTSSTKSNVIVTCNLPEDLEFESATDGQYDKTTHTVTWKINNIYENDAIVLILKAKVKELPEDVYEKIISNKAVVMLDGQEIETNEVNVTVRKARITAKLSSLTPYEISVDDRIEYKILIKNEEKGTAYDVLVEDILPEGLICEDAKYIQNGKTYLIALQDKNKFSTIFDIVPGESEIEVVIIAKPDASKIKEEAKDVVNMAKVSYKQGKEITTNEVKHKILKAGSTNDPSTDGEIIENTYKISGVAWIDENKNGKREDVEQKLEGIQVKLINAENGQIVKDIKTGKEKVQNTNSEGTYTFSNLQNGKYIVIYEYDTTMYEVTEYRKDGVNENANSDAIPSKINENGAVKQVAATDIIKVESNNVYNMDIGLVIRSKFKLSLEKAISKVTVINSKETKVYQWDDTKLAKIEIDPKRIDETNIIIEYKIKVSNIGNVEGYVKKILDYIPQNMKFSSELNKDWYMAENGNLYNSSLANNVIKPGEQKELTLILSTKLSKDNMGIVNNKAEINEAYNNLGIPFEGTTSENNVSMADLAIGIKTGEVPMYVGLIMGSMAIFAIGVYFIKKKV